MRGGSYWNSADRCRSAYRNRNHPANRNDNLGFRVVLPVPEPAVGPGVDPTPSRLVPGDGFPVRPTDRPTAPVRSGRCPRRAAWSPNVRQGTSLGLAKQAGAKGGADSIHPQSLCAPV